MVSHLTLNLTLTLTLKSLRPAMPCTAMPCTALHYTERLLLLSITHWFHTDIEALKRCNSLTAAHPGGSGSQSPILDPSFNMQVPIQHHCDVHTERTNALLPAQPLQPLQYPPFPLCSPSSTRCAPSSRAQLAFLLGGPASLALSLFFSPLSF